MCILNCISIWFSTLAYFRVKNLGTNMRGFLSKCKSFLYLSGSDIYLHRDTNLMPKNPAAWSSWNFRGDVNNKVCLTYWLNVLQVSCSWCFIIQKRFFKIKKKHVLKSCTKKQVFNLLVDLIT